MFRVTGVDRENGECVRLMIDGIDLDNMNRSFPFERVFWAKWERDTETGLEAVCSHCGFKSGTLYDSVVKTWQRCPECEYKMKNKENI